MESATDRNRIAWEKASQKHVREHQELLAQARNQPSLLACELDVLQNDPVHDPAEPLNRSGFRRPNGRPTGRPAQSGRPPDTI
jgi:hypothetical protein